MRERLAVRPGSNLGLAVGERATRKVLSWPRRYRRQAMIVDGGVALLAGALALRGRLNSHGHVPTSYVSLTLVLPFVWVACVALAKGYESRVIGIGADEFRRVLLAGFSLTGAVAIVSFVTSAKVARGYFVVAMPCVVAIDLVARYWMRKRLHRVRALGGYLRRAVAVGHPRDVATLIGELRRDVSHGVSVVGVCLAGGAEPDVALHGVPVQGGLTDVMSVVRQTDADTVAVLACPEMNGTELRSLAWELEKTGTDLCLAPALLDVAGPRTSVRSIAGLPLLYMDHAELTGVRQAIKSLFDWMAAAFAVALFSPLFLALAIAIKMGDGGSVFYRQVRIGRNGRPFKVYKFRTMVPNADQMKDSLLERNEVNGVLFKIRDDPRITSIGSFLRRSSLDEAPQLLNVLRGEMSLVGPRPWASRPYEEAASHGDQVRRRLAVKPGLTGLWQVSGRADLPWEESVRLDLRYVENWSLSLDARILWRTWSAVTRGKGAY
jgi:exopolysaccharide biosynthesis polyprenyl glycosylphosphotransferase